MLSASLCKFFNFPNLDDWPNSFCSKIDQEREGEQIDRALLKNVLDIFVEIGMGQMDCYENDFEADMLKDTSAYYSRKASNWILEDSCPDYMLKVWILGYPCCDLISLFHQWIMSVWYCIYYYRLRSAWNGRKTELLITCILVVSQSYWRFVLHFVISFHLCYKIVSRTPFAWRLKEIVNDCHWFSWFWNILFIFKAFPYFLLFVLKFSFRKFKMNCYLYMQTNSLKKSILDVMHYLEMTRYVLNSCDVYKCLRPVYDAIFSYFP